MKLLTVFCFVVASSHLVTSVTLDCLYGFTFDNFYTCTNLNLHIDKNNMEIVKVNGNHLMEKNDENVVTIYLLSSGMRRLPRGVFKMFKNLKKYVVQGLDTVGEYLDGNALIKGDFNGAKSLHTILLMTVVLEQLRPRVFEGADNLLDLTIEACRITSVDRDAFKGLRKLRSLGLKYNYIVDLHPRTFSDLSALKHLLLSGNFLKKISKDHLKGLKQLNRLSLIGNALTEIDQDLIDGLGELEHFYLDHNMCIDEHFGSDGIPFSKFSKLITLCSKEASNEESMKRQLDEIKILEKEVSTLQHLVEKYKNGNCGSRSMNIAGDTFLLKRNEMP